MGLSPTNRGMLEIVIDQTKERLPETWERFSKYNRGSKGDLVWYLRGFIVATFGGLYQMTNQRAPNEDEMEEVSKIANRRILELSDSIADLPNH